MKIETWNRTHFLIKRNHKEHEKYEKEIQRILKEIELTKTEVILI